MVRFILFFFFLTASLFSQAITEDLEYQKISGVGYSWQHVNFSNNYTDAIVVCSNVLLHKSNNQAVVRINNISSSGFDVKIQQPNDADAGYTTDVYCIISDEGSYTIPLKYEARKVVSTNTNGNSSPNNWNASNAENVRSSIVQSYARPTVLGQVMSYNDNRFSTFWSFDCDSRANRPFQSGMSDGICVGKHVGQIAQTRLNETLGYIVAEAGIYELEDFSMAVNYGSDSVAGAGNTPAYSYTLDKSYTHGVVTKEAEDGGHGGWAVLYGASPFGTSLDLAIDEETVAGDKTRTHTQEEVAYWVMLHDPIASAEMKINEVLYQEATLGTANEEFVEFYVTKSGNLKNYLFTDQDGKSHHYTFSSHTVNQGDYVVLHIGTGTDTVVGSVHHFYKGSSQFLNNGGDEILLLKPSNTDVTVVDGEVINGIPFDYMAYDTVGDSIPTSSKGITLSWNGSEIGRLADTPDGTSISLTPNGTDGDTSLCWEITVITDVAKKASNCTTYIPTIDSNSNAGMINSMGESNTQMPDIKIEKTSVSIYDPINLALNPKAIPGAMVKYTIHARNEGLGSTDIDTIAIADKVPDNMMLCVRSVDRCSEVSFVDGTVSSTLSLNNLAYSNNNGTDFNYTPTADAQGFDADVTNVRVKLNGSFKGSDGVNHPSFHLELLMKIF